MHHNITAEKKIYWLLISAVIGYIIYISKNVLAPFLISFVLCYLLSPVANLLNNKLKLPKSITSVILVLSTVTIFVGIWAVLLPLIYDQFGLLISQVPTFTKIAQQDLIPKIKTLAAHIDPEIASKIELFLNSFVTSFFRVGVHIFNSIWSSSSTIISIITNLLLVPVISFYMMRDWDKLKTNIIELVPIHNKKIFSKLLLDVNNTLSGFIRGQLNVCFMLALYYSFGLWVANINYGMLIGITTGLVSFIPFAGLISGFIAASVVAFFQFGTWLSFIKIVIVFIFGNVLESLLSPKLVGDKVGLHPVWVIFSVLLGGSLFGFVGILVAVPIGAIIGVLIRFAIDLYQHSFLYQKKKFSKSYNKKVNEGTK
jgi:putative permease